MALGGTFIGKDVRVWNECLVRVVRESGHPRQNVEMVDV